jgi:hypothetical protein
MLVRKPEEKRPLGRTERKCYNNIKKDLKRTVFEGVKWVRLCQGRDRGGIL